jgi:hypothetical protein
MMMNYLKTTGTDWSSFTYKKLNPEFKELIKRVETEKPYYRWIRLWSKYIPKNPSKKILKEIRDAHYKKYGKSKLDVFMTKIWAGNTEGHRNINKVIDNALYLTKKGEKAYGKRKKRLLDQLKTSKNK